MLWKMSRVAGLMPRAFVVASWVTWKHHLAQELTCFPPEAAASIWYGCFVFRRVFFSRAGIFLPRLCGASLCSGPLCSDQVLSWDHHHRLQRLPLLRSALVPDTELVRTHTRLVAAFDQSVRSTGNGPHPPLFSFATDQLRFVFRPVCRLQLTKPISSQACGWC